MKKLEWILGELKAKAGCIEMYMRELDTFITVADKGSFLKASEDLFLTPASVMNQINKLEKLAGVPLVNRTNQGTYLTDAGHTFYDHAKQIIALSRVALEKAREVDVASKNIVRIGTSILRPCGPLMDLWQEIDNGSLPVHLQIVPFEDEPHGLAALFTNVDCIIGPCDSAAWQREHNVLELRRIPCRIAVPRKHPLAHHSILTWEDLDGETCLIVRRGNSPILTQIRDDIIENHPKVHIRDVPNFYDTSIFNECERLGCIMESLDIWADVHPSLVTLPMQWEYEMPYGLVYARHATQAVHRFVELIREHTGI